MFVSKRLLGRIPNITLLNTLTAGTYSVYMIPGVYDITACAPGGGGVCGYNGRTGTYSGRARGGVGGTVRVRVRVNSACTATVTIPSTVGRAGHWHGSPSVFNQDWVNAGEAWTAPTAGETTITGIPGLSLTCYGGTGASFYGTTNASGTGTPGVQGGVAISGSAIISVSVNSNNTPITSLASTGIQPNTNEPFTAHDITGGTNYNKPGYGGTPGSRGGGGTGGWGHARIERLS